MSNLGPSPGSAGSVSASSADRTTSAPVTPASLPSLQQPLGYGATGRRTHRKSRTGCATCKTRKIKCDERHPACLNCIAHGVECPFLKGGPTATAAARTSKARAHSAASPASSWTPKIDRATSPPDGPLPLLELELLHNFTSKTCTTLAAEPSLWDFWRDDVFQLGLTCDYIMHALLAVSALHLAYHRPDRRDFYIESGILLHQKAARSAMRVMAAGSKIDKDQAASLFVFSMLTMFFALASPRRSDPDGTFFIGESGFPDWAFLLSGSKSIMDVLGERGRETAAAPFLRYGGIRWRARCAMLDELRQQYQQHQQQSPPSPSHPSSTSLLGPESPLALLRARITASVADPDLLDTYTHALDELELALAVGSLPVRDPMSSSATTTITTSTTNPNTTTSAPPATAAAPTTAADNQNNTIPASDPATDATVNITMMNPPYDVLDAMVWLWEVSDSLVPLLRVPTQEAVAVFAHFCVLLKQHESVWWLRGWSDHIIGRAVEILDEEHQDWIDWPVKETGWVSGR